MKKVHRRWSAVLLAATLVAACGGDNSGSSDASGSPSPTGVESSIPADAPQRIVSLSPSHTEMLFAIGAGEQVVAVDSLSTYPTETEAVLTDLSAFEPNVEAISEYEPDLVVISDDSSGISGQLAAIGIDTWIGLAPTTLDEVYEQIAELGDRVGRAEGAKALVADMSSTIDEIVASAPALDEPLTYYHELDDTYFSVTSNTFIGSLYSMLGLRNIADATEGDTDYPQLSAEFIVTQDPDLIFLADTKCCGVTADTVAARPGWEGLTAVTSGNVIEMDDDIASRWGPRVVDYLRAIADAVAGVVG
ncbi:MAG: ABC transporter substrate-binding protein [Actinomycetota bacterium]